ncbi:MAG: hypothetical protein CL925_17970 [Deltaproteobacteria bacterium]|nr:hypothetical protein [Deltaproteobacteria bacterium]
MDWSNRFCIEKYTFTYSTFQRAWEVIEKRQGNDVAFRWYSSRKKAETFCSKKISHFPSLR